MDEVLRRWVDELWLSIYDLSGRNDLILHGTVPWVILMVVYWTTGIFFTAVDLTGKPKSIIQYKIPDPTGRKYPRVSRERLSQVVSQVLINQTLVAGPIIYLCCFLKFHRGCEKELPSAPRFVLDIAAQILAEEFFFYYSHRLLHYPPIYKRIHKKHHEWTSPIGVSAIYCHPVEHVLSNVLPTFAGSVLISSHPVSLWAWLIFATAYGVIVHSGYHLPLMPTPEFHHYHHLKFTENFGVAGILDRLHGTDTSFRKSKYFNRNKVLFSFKPLQ